MLNRLITLNYFRKTDLGPGPNVNALGPMRNNQLSNSDNCETLEQAPKKVTESWMQFLRLWF